VILDFRWHGDWWRTSILRLEVLGADLGKEGDAFPQAEPMQFSSPAARPSCQRILRWKEISYPPKLLSHILFRKSDRLGGACSQRMRESGVRVFAGEQHHRPHRVSCRHPWHDACNEATKVQTSVPLMLALLSGEAFTWIKLLNYFSIMLICILFYVISSSVMVWRQNAGVHHAGKSTHAEECFPLRTSPHPADQQPTGWGMNEQRQLTQIFGHCHTSIHDLHPFLFFLHLSINHIPYWRQH
jgi:hypothetical protein